MNQAIVIATTPSTQNWLNNCRKSFMGYPKYNIIVISDYGFEMSKIRKMYETTNYDEFLLLLESYEIKNTDIFDMFFETDGSVSLDNGGKCYTVKYKRSVLDDMIFPIVVSKQDAVIQEDLFHAQYEILDPFRVLFKGFNKNEKVFEQKFGRNNLILENDYLKKYKGTWSRGQLSLT